MYRGNYLKLFKFEYTDILYKVNQSPDFYGILVSGILGRFRGKSRKKCQRPSKKGQYHANLDLIQIIKAIVGHF